MSKRYGLLLIPVTLAVLFGFQNCSDVEFETIESPSVIRYNQQCVPADFPALEPVEKFRWDYANSNYPEYQNVMSTPMVGDINGDKIPEIVFSSYAGSYGAPGVMRVISGKDGNEIRSLKNDDLAPRGDSSPVLIDIDRDGRAEIVYVHHSYKKVIALNYDLSERWQYALPEGEDLNDCIGGPAAGDLDRDGRAEVIIENIVLTEAADRTVAATRLGPYQRTNCTTFAISADPLRPNEMQVVTGAGVYRPDGTPLMLLPAVDAATRGRRLAVADLDKNYSGLEIVYVDTGRIHAYNILSGQELWPSIPLATDPARFSGAPGNGGPPTIADFTGDGKPDIAVAGAVFYSIYNQKGELIWQKETNDHSSQITGSSSFDFNGDGISEVLYADEGYLRIYNGPTGDTLFTVPNPSHTHLEYPVVADCDNDGHSDLILAGNTATLAAARWETDPVKLDSIRAAGPGIKVYGAKSAEKWVPTQPIWNQYSYYVLNVKDNFTAPSSTPIGAGQEIEVFRQNKLDVFDKKICRNVPVPPTPSP